MNCPVTAGVPQPRETHYRPELFEVSKEEGDWDSTEIPSRAMKNALAARSQHVVFLLLACWSYRQLVCLYVFILLAHPPLPVHAKTRRRRRSHQSRAAVASGSPRSCRHEQAMRHSFACKQHHNRFNNPRLSSASLPADELVELGNITLATMHAIQVTTK